MVIEEVKTALNDVLVHLVGNDGGCGSGGCGCSGGVNLTIVKVPLAAVVCRTAPEDGCGCGCSGC